MSRSDKVVDSINEHMSAQKENADGKHASFLDEVLDNVSRSGEVLKEQQIKEDAQKAYSIMIDAKIEELKKELISDWAQSICNQIKSGIKEKALYGAAVKNKTITGMVVEEIYKYRGVTNDDLSKLSCESLKSRVTQGDRNSAFSVRDLENYEKKAPNYYNKKLVLHLLDYYVEKAEETYTYQGRSWIFFKREKKAKRKVTRCKIYNETRVLIDEVKRIALQDGIIINDIYFSLNFEAAYEYVDEHENYEFKCNISVDNLIISVEKEPRHHCKLFGYSIVGYPGMDYIFNKFHRTFRSNAEKYAKRPKIVFEYSFNLV